MNEFNNIKNRQISIIKNISDSFEKGKVAIEGEIRTRSDGEKYKKQGQNWIHVVAQKDKKEEDNKKQETSDKKLKVSETEKHPFQNIRDSISNEELSSKIQETLNSIPAGKKGEIGISLYKLGLKPSEIVNVSGVKIATLLFHLNNFKSSNSHLYEKESSSNKETNGPQNKPANKDKNEESQELIPYDKLPEISVKDRWDSYENFGHMICLGMGKSMISYGSGGVGKTYTLMGEGQIFDQYKMKSFDEDMHIISQESGVSQNLDEDGNPIRMAEGIHLNKDNYDYVKITGNVSAVEMYKKLFEHNEKIVVFDDCDSVLEDDNAVNVLKGALDTSGDGTIEWATKGNISTDYDNLKGTKPIIDIKGKKVGNGVPKRFKFTGTVLFISNKVHKQMPQALLSRALTVDLTMNAEETIDRMEDIYPKMKFKDPKGNNIEVSKEDRKDAFEFLKKYKNDLNTSDLNMRTFTKVALIKKTIEERGSNADWTKTAISMLKKK